MIMATTNRILFDAERKGLSDWKHVITILWKSAKFPNCTIRSISLTLQKAKDKPGHKNDAGWGGSLTPSHHQIQCVCAKPVKFPLSQSMRQKQLRSKGQTHTQTGSAPWTAQITQALSSKLSTWQSKPLTMESKKTSTGSHLYRQRSQKPRKTTPWQNRKKATVENEKPVMTTTSMSMDDSRLTASFLPRQYFYWWHRKFGKGGRLSTMPKETRTRTNHL